MKVGSKKNLGLYAFFALINAALLGLMNVKFGAMTDHALSKNFDLMFKTGILVLGISVGSLVVVWFQNRFIKGYVKASMISLRENYVNRLFKRHRMNDASSQYVSHLTNDADRLEQQYYVSIISMISLLATVIVSLVILVRVSIIFVGVVALLALIFYFMARKTSQPVKKEEEVKSKELETYTRFIEETLDGFSVIKGHQIEERREDEFNVLIDALRKRQYKLEKKMSIVDCFNSIVQGIIIALLVVLGLYIAQSSGISIGSTMVLILVFSDILWPLQRVTPLITEMSAIHSVFEDYECVLNDTVVNGSGSVREFDGLQFIDASLGYDEAILRDVNLSIMPHEKVLVVGPSGAGKSTVLKTIQRDIDVIDGKVNLNNSSINSFDLDDYYKLFSVVDQIGFVFSGTIQENVSMLQDADVEEILKQVGLGHLNNDFLLKNNGDNVSGGERARILLARTLYFNKEVVVCDEILSSLDASIAKMIERDILENAKTLINVSHIVFVDNLPLYDKFVIVENGRLSVTDNPQLVIDRMLESDVVIN